MKDLWDGWITAPFFWKNLKILNDKENSVYIILFRPISDALRAVLRCLQPVYSINHWQGVCKLLERHF